MSEVDGLRLALYIMIFGFCLVGFIAVVAIRQRDEWRAMVRSAIEHMEDMRRLERDNNRG